MSLNPDKTYRVRDRVLIHSADDDSWWWESVAGAGRAWLHRETGLISLGPSKVYSAFHHYPCGDANIDADLVNKMEQRERAHERRMADAGPLPDRWEIADWCPL